MIDDEILNKIFNNRLEIIEENIQKEYHKRVKRIQNEDIIDEKIEKFLNGEVEIEAIQKKKSGNIINYQMDITKKISSDNINDLNQNNN